MSRVVMLDPVLLVGGYDLSGDTSRMAMQMSATEVDATTFGSGGWTESDPGLLKSVFQQEGFFAAQPTDEHLWANFGGSAVPVSIAHHGAAEGEVAYTARMHEIAYETGGAVGERFRFSAGGFCNGPLVRGIVAHRAARASTGTGTVFTLGAVAAGQQLYAALHVLAASGGSPTLDLVVQSDDASGMSSPTSRIAFAQASGIGAQFLTAAGPITDTHWRLSWTIGGSTPSLTFAVVLGIL